VVRPVTDELAAAVAEIDPSRTSLFHEALVTQGMPTRETIEMRPGFGVQRVLDAGWDNEVRDLARRVLVVLQPPSTEA
jgi:hypothetical protein